MPSSPWKTAVVGRFGLSLLILWSAQGALLFWGDPGLTLPTGSHSEGLLQVWIVALVTYAMGVVSVSLVLGSLASLPGWRRPFAGLVLWSLLAFLPLLPDGFYAFAAASAPLWARLGLFLLATLSVLLIPILLRSAVLILAKWELKRSPDARWRSLRGISLLLLPLAELTTLSVTPVAALGTLPPPVAPGLRLEQWWGPAAGETGQGQEDAALRLLSLVYASHWRDDLRRVAAHTPVFGDGKEDRGQGRQPQGLWLSLQEDFERQVPQVSAQTVRIYFPETLFDVLPSALANLVELLDGSIRRLIPGVEQVEIVAGVGNSENNVLVWATQDPLTGRVRFAKFRSKEILVPFFEKPVAGLSYHPLGGQVYDPGWKELPPVSQVVASPSAMPLGLICYEALFPSLWDGQSAVSIFTNHNVFSRFGLASRAYDLKLRTVTSLLGQPSLLVPNGGGASGLVWPATRKSSAYQPEIGMVSVIHGQSQRTLEELLLRDTAVTED